MRDGSRKDSFWNHDRPKGTYRQQNALQRHLPGWLWSANRQGLSWPRAKEEIISNVVTYWIVMFCIFRPQRIRRTGTPKPYRCKRPRYVQPSLESSLDISVVILNAIPAVYTWINVDYPERSSYTTFRDRQWISWCQTRQPLQLIQTSPLAGWRTSKRVERYSARKHAIAGTGPVTSDCFFVSRLTASKVNLRLDEILRGLLSALGTLSQHGCFSFGYPPTTVEDRVSVGVIVVARVLLMQV
jgi:hypothetical protein